LFGWSIETDAAGVDEDQFTRLGLIGDIDTERPEQGSHGAHVGDVGNVRESMFTRGVERGDHQLQDRVLGSGHDDLSAKRPAAVHHDAVHRPPSMLAPWVARGGI
jgi:hypothetical protein